MYSFGFKFNFYQTKCNFFQCNPIDNNLMVDKIKIEMANITFKMKNITFGLEIVTLEIGRTLFLK